MRKLSTVLSTAGLAGLLMSLTWTAGHAQQPPQVPATTAAPSAALFKQYCVGCHNERQKGNFGNLSLENIDPADVSSHIETLEKVARKLRKGLMPPEGRPRPDQATLDAFTASLECALDRAADRQPNPG